MNTRSQNPIPVLNAFGDVYCRDILVTTVDSSISAATLAERLDISPPTVYKRLNQLLELDLLREHPVVGDDGTHYRVFDASLQRVVIDIDADGYTVHIEHRQDLDNRFEALWTEFSNNSHRKRESHESSDPQIRRKKNASSL